MNLTEFVNEIIKSTMEAIISSQIEQERKIADLLGDLELSDEDLIDKYDLQDEIKEIEHLSKSDVERNNLKNELLESHRELVRTLAKKGIPKTIIDKGRIKLKAIISSESQKSEEPIGSKNKTVKQFAKTPIKDYGILQEQLSNKILSSSTLAVGQNRKLPKIKVDLISNLEDGNLNNEILSEIELEFKSYYE